MSGDRNMQASGDNNIVENSLPPPQATRGTRRDFRQFTYTRKALQLWIGKLKMRILTIVICLRPSDKIWLSSRSEVSNSGSKPTSAGQTASSQEAVQSRSQPSKSVSPKSSTPSNAGGSITPPANSLKTDSEPGDKPSLQINEGGLIVPGVKPRAEERSARCSFLHGYPGDNGNFDCFPRVKRNKYPAGHPQDARAGCFPCCRKISDSEVDLEELSRLLREQKARERASNLIAWRKEERERAKRSAARCRTSLGLYSIRDIGQNFAQGLGAFIWAPPEVMLYSFSPATHENPATACAKRPKLHWVMQKPILENENLWRNSLRAYHKIRKKTTVHHFNKFVGRDLEVYLVNRGQVKQLPASDKRPGPPPDASSRDHDLNGIPDYGTLSRRYNPGHHSLPTRKEGSSAEGSSKLSRRGPNFEHQGKKKRFGTLLSQLHRQKQTVRVGKYEGTGPLRGANFHCTDTNPSPSSFHGQAPYTGRQSHEKHDWYLGKKVSSPSCDSRVHGEGHLSSPESFSKSQSPRSPRSPPALQSCRQTRSKFPSSFPSPRTPDGLHDNGDLNIESGKPVSYDAKTKFQPATRKKLSSANVKKPLRDGKRRQSLETPIAKGIILRTSKRGGTPDITVKKLFLVSDTASNKGKARRSPKASSQQEPRELALDGSVSDSQKGNNEEGPMTTEISSEHSRSGKLIDSDKSRGEEGSQVDTKVEQAAQKPANRDNNLMPYDLDAVAAQLKDEPVIIMNVDSSTMGPITNKRFQDGESKGSRTPQDYGKSQGSPETNLSKDTKLTETPSSKSSDTDTFHGGKPVVEGKRMDTDRNGERGHKRPFSGVSYTKSSFLAGDLAYSQALDNAGTEPIEPPKFTSKKARTKDESTQVHFQHEETLNLGPQISPETQMPGTRAGSISEEDERSESSSKSAPVKQEYSGLYLRPVARPSLNDNGVPFSKPGLYQVLEPPEDTTGGKVLSTSLTKRSSITEETLQEPSLRDPASPSAVHPRDASPSDSIERTVSFSSDKSVVSSDDDPSISEENLDKTQDLHLRQGRVRRPNGKSRVIVRSSLIPDGVKDFGPGNRPIRSSRFLDGIEDELDAVTSSKRRSSPIRIHSFLNSMAQRSSSVELSNLILQELARKNLALLKGLGYRVQPDSQEGKSSLSTMSTDNEDGDNRHPVSPASNMSNRSSRSTSENTPSANREFVAGATEPYYGSGGTSPSLDARGSPSQVENLHSSGSPSEQRVVEIPRSSAEENATGSASGNLLLPERSGSLRGELSANASDDEDELNGYSVSSDNGEDSGHERMPGRRSRVIMRSSVILGEIKDNGPGKSGVRPSRILDLSGIDDSELERYSRRRPSNVRIHSFLHPATQRGKSVELNNLISQELAKNPALRDRITVEDDSEERNSIPSKNFANNANEGNAPRASASDVKRTTPDSPSENLSSMDREPRASLLSSGANLDSETFVDHILSLSTEIPQTEVLQASDGDDSDLQHLVVGGSRTPGEVVPSTDRQNELLEQGKSPKHGRIHAILQTMIAQSRGPVSIEPDLLSVSTEEEDKPDQLGMRNVPSSSTSRNPDTEQPTFTAEHDSQMVNSSLDSAQEATSQAHEISLDSDSLTSNQPTTSQYPDEHGSLAFSAHQISGSSDHPHSSESKPPAWMEKWRSDRFADFPPAPLPSVSRNDGEDSPPPTPSSGPPSTPPHQLEFIQAFWNKNT